MNGAFVITFTSKLILYALKSILGFVTSDRSTALETSSSTSPNVKESSNLDCLGRDLTDDIDSQFDYSDDNFPYGSV